MDLKQALSTRPDLEKVFSITAFIGTDPERFAELINLVLYGDKTVSQYASWLIYPCIENNPQLIQPHLQTLISNLSRPILHHWVIRSTVKALSYTDDIPEELQGYALQHCFDYLLNPKIAVSTHVYAMQTIFNISKNEPDLLRELKMVIEEQLPHGTAAYKARGKRLLKEIKNILNQKPGSYLRPMNLQEELLPRPNKEKIIELTAYVGSDPSRFAILMDLVLHGEESTSKHASWLINHCMERNPQLIRPHLRALIENLGRPKLSDWIVRCSVKALAEAGDIPEDLQGHALQYCFDYLLNPKTAVAIQAHAMQTAFNISKNEPDLLRELYMVIEEKLPHGKPGIISRGRRIMKDIRKILNE